VRALAFAAGVVLGVFSLLIAQNLGFFRFRQRPGRPADLSTGGDGAVAARRGESGGASEDEVADRIARALGDPQGKNLDALAVALEEALYEQDWAKVQAVAALIRARGAEWVAPPVAPPPAPVEEKSLYDQELEVARKREEALFARRRNAATALAGKADPASIGQLVDILQRAESPDDERLDAARLLARSGDERGLRVLVEGLRSPEKAIRLAAGKALAAEDSLTGAREAAAILASEPDPAIRLTALACAGNFDAARRGEPQHPATRALIDALRKDDSPEVRAAAATWFEGDDLENGRALADALFEALAHDESQRVRAAVIDALDRNAREFGPPPGSVEAAARQLALERSAAVRKKLLGYLGEWGAEAALAAIDELAAAPGAGDSAETIAAARKKIADRLAAARR
jgi:hypothetical protein